jgi:beta-lactamase regulating signal transducer with metallopeptidase domain
MSQDFLLEMAWKSGVICTAALIFLWALRQRAPADRATVLRVAMALLLALPLISLNLPALEIERPLPASQSVAELPAAVLAVPAEPSQLDAFPPTESVATLLPEDVPAPALLSGNLPFYLYLAGLALMLGRLLIGLITLRRWTAAAASPHSREWSLAFERMRDTVGAKAGVRLLVSDRIDSPLSWGVRAPVILVDRESFARPEDAEAILAHEFAHVTRRDWPALMLSRVVVALFWFNPLVWLIERQLIQQAEEAADAEALNRLEPSRYAQSLLSCLRCSSWRALPANSMAPANGLARRVHAILDSGLRRNRSGPAWTAAVLIAFLCISSPLAAVKLVDAAAHSGILSGPAAPAEPTAITAPADLRTNAAARVHAPVSQTVEASTPAGVTLGTPPNGASLRAPVAPAPQVATLATPAPPLSPAALAAAPAETQPRPASQASAPARGELIDVNTLVEMQIHGVNARYIEEMKAATPASARRTPRDLINLRIHGISAQRVREYARAGYPNLSDRELVSLSNHGVSAAFIREMASAGHRNLTPAQLVSLKIRGKTVRRAAPSPAAIDAAVRRAMPSRESLDAMIERKVRETLRTSGADAEDGDEDKDGDE